jgi:hypothetical protein
MNNERPKPQFTLVKIFEDQGFAIQVCRSDERRPKYSMEIGKKNSMGKFLRFFHFGFDPGRGTDDPLTVRRSEATALAALVEEVEDWVENQMREDEKDALAKANSLAARVTPSTTSTLGARLAQKAAGRR